MVSFNNVSIFFDVELTMDLHCDVFQTSQRKGFWWISSIDSHKALALQGVKIIVSLSNMFFFGFAFCYQSVHTEHSKPSEKSLPVTFFENA